MATTTATETARPTLPRVEGEKFETTVRERVRQLMREDSERDPKAIVEALLLEFVRAGQKEMLIEAARYGLREMAWAMVRYDRSPDRREGRSKWSAASKNRDLLLSRFVLPSGEIKFLHELTKADLRALAGDRRDRAAELVRWEKRFEKLARKVPDGQTVGDLDRAVVEKIFNA